MTNEQQRITLDSIECLLGENATLKTKTIGDAKITLCYRGLAPYLKIETNNPDFIAMEVALRVYNVDPDEPEGFKIVVNRALADKQLYLANVSFFGEIFFFKTPVIKGKLYEDDNKKAG